MKVVISKASDWDYKEVKEINTLEELLKIYHSLIIDTDKTIINLYKEKIELKRQIKKQNEVINKAIKYINENVFLDDNGCGGYWWEIADKDKLLDILKEVEI